MLKEVQTRAFIKAQHGLLKRTSHQRQYILQIQQRMRFPYTLLKLYDFISMSALPTLRCLIISSSDGHRLRQPGI